MEINTDFEIEQIKWLNPETNEPPIDTDCWVLTRTVGGRLVCTYGTNNGKIWRLLDSLDFGSVWIKSHDEIISFFVLPDHEQAPIFKDVQAI